MLDRSYNVFPSHSISGLLSPCTAGAADEYNILRYAGKHHAAKRIFDKALVASGDPDKSLSPRTGQNGVPGVGKAWEYVTRCDALLPGRQVVASVAAPV